MHPKFRPQYETVHKNIAQIKQQLFSSLGITRNSMLLTQANIWQYGPT
jgi:hypothetical protein